MVFENRPNWIQIPILFKVYYLNNSNNSNICLTFWLPECPIREKTTRNREDQEVINNIRNWGECSQVCKQKDTCNHWTWYSDGAVYQCITMSKYGSTETNRYAVSGDRDCEGIKHFSYWLWTQPIKL